MRWFSLEALEFHFYVVLFTSVNRGKLDRNTIGFSDMVLIFLWEYRFQIGIRYLIVKCVIFTVLCCMFKKKSFWNKSSWEVALKFIVKNLCFSLYFHFRRKEGNVEFGTNTRSNGIPSVSRRWCRYFGQYNHLICCTSGAGIHEEIFEDNIWCWQQKLNYYA